ncbi:lasso RiPP family leader peptide-containing protein [Streptosporangium sp. NPDC048865]
MSEEIYEVPALVEVGNFSELTRDSNRGKWLDSFFGYYFD